MHDEKNEHVSRHRGPMGGPPGGKGEKPKNTKEALSKLINYSRNFLPVIIIALICAAAGAIFSIIGPNKLSDLADEIGNGIVLNIDNFKTIQESIQNDLSKENIENKSKQIMTNSTVDGVEILPEDKIVFMELMSKISETTDSDTEKFSSIESLPDNIKQILLPKIVIDNLEITTEDKLDLIEKMSTLNKDELSDSTKIYKIVDDLSDNLKSVIKPKINFDVIKKITMFLVTVYVLSALANFTQSFIMATVANKISKKLRTNISEKINKLPLRYFDKHSYGDVLSRVTNDVDLVGQSISQSLGTFVSAITLFIGSIIMMVYTNGTMAITAILSSAIGFAFMGLILGKSQKYFTARQTELGKMNGHIEEVYSGYNVVKVYNGNKKADKKFDELNKKLFECNRKSQFLSGLMSPLMNFIGNFSYVAVCIVGALLVINGNISFGVIVAFMVYVRLFTNPLSQIAQGLTSLQSALASSERVFEFIDEAEMLDESDKKIRLEKENVKGKIEFEHVKFQYDNNPNPTILDFSAIAKPGQKIAIVGPTGAGKTTLVNLIMKFYELTDGKIKIDGISNKDLTRENIHDLFIMVLQDTWLFEGTLRENIVYNQKNVKDETVMQICKMIGLEHFVKSLPHGLDTEINDSESVSSGQRQLITIARGMIKNAPFLILDEATSNVDTRTEEVVQKAMDKLTEGRTSFIIAHRLSTIKNADLILVIKDGNIIEQGNHEELLKKNGFYADLYNSQFEDVG